MDRLPAASRSDRASVGRRHEVLVVAVVGGLSALVSILYIWAVQLAAQTSPAIGIATIWSYVAWAVLTVLSAGLLLWHRRYPLRVFVLVFGFYVIGSVLVGDAGTGGMSLPLWFAVYAVAAYARVGVGSIVVAIGWVLNTVLQALLVTATGLPISAQAVAAAALSRGFFFAACFMIGLGIRAQQQRASDAAERAELVEAKARAEAVEAVAHARNHMARELHDLAAHQLMDVLLTARAALIQAPDPVLGEIEEKTSEALRSIRSVVGALRDDEADDTSTEPLASAARRVIADTSQERGLDVDTRIEIAGDVGAGVSQTVLSILKEALVNASVHAPRAPISVALNADADELRLDVRNPLDPQHDSSVRHGTDTGYGLQGAAERARILSGSLTTGRSADGHWILALTVPNLASSTEETS